MSSKYKDKDVGALLSFNGRWVSWAHTGAAYAAFLSALVVGISLHYQKIVQNEWFGYPQEWFPSVSATIGDRFPERSFFMFFIAITSGPRFALVGLWYLLTAKPGHSLPKTVGYFGVFRTITCGGWTFVTSTDNHDWHDIFMISYLVATIPWMFGCITLSPANATAVKYRKYVAGAFFGAIVPLVYFFIQHKVHRVPGAYTTYAFFEWSLVLFDVAFDAVTALDFDTLEIVVKDTRGTSKGAPRSAIEVTKVDKEKLKAAANAALSTRFAWPDVFDAAADIYHGFAFWSVLTSLGLTVWYFPLWHMGISGYEAFVMSTLSPVILAIRPLRNLIVKYQRFFHLLSVAGLVAYKVDDPVYRLFTIGFGVSMQCLAWVATFYSDAANEAKIETRVLSFIFGLLMSSIAKFAWHTNNPIWPIMHAENGGWNGTGLVLAILAALRFTRKRPVLGGDVSRNDKSSSALYALSIGGLLFALHSLLSDTSTMVLWVWEGYPVRGPLSNTHAYYTIFAMTGGAFLGVTTPGLVSSWSAFGIASVGAAVLTLYGEWFGFYGATTLSVYLMALAVPLISSASKKSPALTFGLGFLIYNFMVLFHVWVVAYAFVPGGPLVREHTDWIMTVMMLLIGCGVFNLNTAKIPRQAPKYQKRAQTTQRRKYYYGVAGVLNIFFLIAAFIRFPTNDYKPYHAEDRVITAGIWTIHFSLDNDMWSSERRMRDLIKEAELDVIGLLESDLQRIIMGNRDTTQFLAEDLGMYVDYGPGPNKHTWGAALLSKFPIVNSTHHLLPSPVGELAPAIHATLDVYGTLVDVFVFHSGQEEDPEDRRQQSEYLARLMGTSTRPSFLLSYLVTRPLEGNYNTYVSKKSGMHDVDPSDWDRWCEYILFKGLQRIGYARISRSTITDTELQVAKFVVPDSQERTDYLFNVEAEARNHRVQEHEIPEGWRFPALFRGEGVRGHRYHVFDEPRYYGY
ncbi:calcofluor white hypersensitive protein [Ophiostoma piceae UAMH 11346]|uniref:Calcofluor white hypersensitive protein n=1 Tax=Ophiostoma piceae (strain UAMH 11346) TaxID=1262450 RepID=S3CPQ8_OPHP1|nr:calcofluor white hypersensitive protein [Ophiostoma piceae UAMH 11346]